MKFELSQLFIQNIYFLFRKSIHQILKNLNIDKLLEIILASIDLSNGVALVELAQILIGKESPHHWIHDPIRIVDMVQNCDLSIEMFEKDGVHLVGNSINHLQKKIIMFIHISCF